MIHYCMFYNYFNVFILMLLFCFGRTFSDSGLTKGSTAGVWMQFDTFSKAPPLKTRNTFQAKKAVFFTGKLWYHKILRLNLFMVHLHAITKADFFLSKILPRPGFKSASSVASAVDAIWLHQSPQISAVSPGIGSIYCIY